MEPEYSEAYGEQLRDEQKFLEERVEKRSTYMTFFVPALLILSLKSDNFTKVNELTAYFLVTIISLIIINYAIAVIRTQRLVDKMQSELDDNYQLSPLVYNQQKFKYPPNAGIFVGYIVPVLFAILIPSYVLVEWLCTSLVLLQ